MTYVLLAIVGRGLVAELPPEDRDKVIDLVDGFQLVHLERPSIAGDDLVKGSYQMSRDGLDRLRTRLPGPPPRALLEAELWAGTGWQFSMAWERGVELLPATTTSNDLSPDDPPGGPWPNPPMREWAINRALRALGVTAPADSHHEFSWIGLDEGPIQWAWQDDTAVPKLRWT